MAGVGFSTHALMSKHISAYTREKGYLGWMACGPALDPVLPHRACGNSPANRFY